MTQDNNGWENYGQRMETQLEGWETELEQLMDRVGEVGEDARTMFVTRAESLRSRIDHLRDSLHQAQQAQGESLEPMQTSIDHQIAELENEFQQITARLDDLTRYR